MPALVHTAFEQLVDTLATSGLMQTRFEGVRKRGVRVPHDSEDGHLNTRVKSQMPRLLPDSALPPKEFCTSIMLHRLYTSLWGGPRYMTDFI